MSWIKRMLSSVGMLAVAASTAMAAPIALMQDPAVPVRVEVQTSESHTVWYASPTWIAVGVVAVVLIIVLAIMASRNRDSTTTVIR